MCSSDLALLMLSKALVVVTAVEEDVAGICERARGGWSAPWAWQVGSQGRSVARGGRYPGGVAEGETQEAGYRYYCHAPWVESVRFCDLGLGDGSCGGQGGRSVPKWSAPDVLAEGEPWTRGGMARLGLHLRLTLSVILCVTTT